jgi:hypothetical protein
MSITGSLLIGGVARRGKDGKFCGGAASDADPEGAFGGTTKDRPRIRGLPLPPVAAHRFTEVRSQRPRTGVSTSVGNLAIDRFMRPVCYQHLPAAPPPDALKRQ